MIPVTPRGFKDVLPDEARWRESITSKLRHTLSSWGYAPIETPTLEVLEVLEQGGKLSEPPFCLFDSDGTLLALRPDVTLPVARLVASRLKDALQDAQRPLRLRYVQQVFREEESLRGQAREFTQIGVEAIKAAGPSADAEIILLMVDALKACGLTDFMVAICTVGVLRDLIDAIEGAGKLGSQWREEVLAACHQSNAVELARLAGDPRIDARYGQALRLLFGLHGGSEAIERCRALVEPLGCADGLDDLAQTYGIIERVGQAAHVTIDFSVMSAFDYYTGLVLEAYAPRLGVPMGAGGRYDRMLEAYGASFPAAGFALNLERVMITLAQQGAEADTELLCPEYSSVAVDVADPALAFLSAERLRASGTCAILDLGGTSK
ncbi:MAG: ATP phosphoribosyltransferase regulatory subunit [Coriobacteriales bacterium]|jgi:ATP phosphoribosyltransferase regulatory subunit|nr:ATP phosphoribosyltransferase regulatory subunit [Coriobacteriales bacterium]